MNKKTNLNAEMILILILILEYYITYLVQGS